MPVSELTCYKQLQKEGIPNKFEIFEHRWFKGGK